jgi:Predicted molecular chaperone distantly related to HSP70-fold metalloproteases
MVYRALGLMSGSSLDGLDIVYAEFNFNFGSWQFEILASACYPYSKEWKQKLQNSIHLTAKDYLLLHSEYGHYLGKEINRFIEENQLDYKVAIIASHGHTTFHIPKLKMTAQLGNGASIAAETGLPVITDLRSMDVAFDGEGAPIVPVGEKLLFKDYSIFLNLGGIANISIQLPDQFIAFDVCPANRILNMLADTAGKEFDDNGIMASMGMINSKLLESLNTQDYYSRPYPKSLSNDFGVSTLYPIIKNSNLSVKDALRTYVQHVVFQIKKVLIPFKSSISQKKMLVTGGGAFNNFMIELLRKELEEIQIEVVVPAPDIVNYKEALIMAFIGVLRWRQENNVLASVTGASRDSIGGALWTGQEA